jgi:hypothetical protein
LLLVLGEGFGGKEIQRARVLVSDEAIQDRQVVTQRLPTGGAGRDDQVAPILDLAPCVLLVAK